MKNAFGERALAARVRLGIKVHWRDVDAMVAIADNHGVEVLEYQMLAGDVERHRDDARDALIPHRARFELRVHPPESYLHDGEPRFLDISSPDPDERARSLGALEACARHAKDLGATAMIVHPGGVWRGNVGGGPELLRDSLLRFPRHVPLLLENMPHFAPAGDFPAAFRIPSGLRSVDDLVDGFVLDVSHAFLAVPQGSAAVVDAFARDLGPRIKHVHANGSRAGMGRAGEGTPFWDSDYGAELVRGVLARVAPDAVVVPEIMGGHLDGGMLFDEGLAFLRPLLPESDGSSE